MVSDELCNICGDKLSDKYTISLNCNHTYHYECIQKTFMYDRKKMNNCPLCRQSNGILPLVNGLQKLIKGIHYVNEYPKTYNAGKCCEILKSGKRKGMTCGIKCALGMDICKRHHTSKIKKEEKLQKKQEKQSDKSVSTHINDLNITNEVTVV